MVGKEKNIFLWKKEIDRKDVTEALLYFAAGAIVMYIIPVLNLNQAVRRRPFS